MYMAHTHLQTGLTRPELSKLVDLKQPSEGDQSFATSRRAFWDIDFKLIFKKEKTQNL